MRLNKKCVNLVKYILHNWLLRFTLPSAKLHNFCITISIGQYTYSFCLYLSLSLFSFPVRSAPILCDDGA